ncbi:hypothetical protein Y032_0039g26 [Ancylostoma ceylanicum]|uniref:Uncharacterized protein n=1 Tax=Ancylostoma ceylanicum TaxID=53326 RepID=A0A016UHG9_9BILA|nr:hypothetical protein Y032_0039g26 [Ancylostoma ceylanicum]
MIEGFGMNDIALLRAMKRQTAYSSMRGLAMYLQRICYPMKTYPRICESTRFATGYLYPVNFLSITIHS